MEITIEWLQKYGCEMEYLRAFAGRFGKKALVYYVIEWLSPSEGNPIHILNYWGRQELKSWLLSREINMAKEMLEHGASIHDNEGKHLFLAISEGNLEMTIFFLKNGAYPHFPTHFPSISGSYRSGLYIAAEKGYLRIIKALIAHSSDLYSYEEIIDKIILENKHPEITKFLVDYRKKEDQRMSKKQKMNDTTFVTNDPRIEGKIMQLGHAFTQAVAENNAKLAEDICQEALALKGKTK